MRVIITAIALIFVIGVAPPTEAEARAPLKVERWGCTFKAGGFSHDTIGGPITWFGYGRVRHCDKKSKFVVNETIYEAIPGARDRLHVRNRYVTLLGPHHSPVGVGGGRCKADARRPAYPYYYQMTVKRKGKPGVVRVASPNKANPCPKGTWPSGR